MFLVEVPELGLLVRHRVVVIPRHIHSLDPLTATGTRAMFISDTRDNTTLKHNYMTNITSA